MIPRPETDAPAALTFHLGVSGAPVSHLDAVLLVALVVDAHVGHGGAHGVSRAVAVGRVVHVVHRRLQVGLQMEDRTRHMTAA